jgi:hypothetical protein
MKVTSVRLGRRNLSSAASRNVRDCVACLRYEAAELNLNRFPQTVLQTGICQVSRDARPAQFVGGGVGGGVHPSVSPSKGILQIVSPRLSVNFVTKADKHL